MERYEGSIVKDDDGNVFFFCSQCGCYWKPRNEKVKPRNCPSCRSTVWMKPYFKKKCARCGHEWGTTHDDTKRCPSCGTYRWNEAPVNYHCFRCNNDWNAKRDWVPKRCPKCNSTKWQTPMEDRSESGRTDRAVTELDQKVIDLLMKKYIGGESCTSIAISMKIPFSTVFRTVSNLTEDKTINI